MTDEIVVPSRHNWFVRILLILICAVLATMWIFYFFFASDKGVYQLQDTSWREKASPICVAAQAERAEDRKSVV